MLLFTKGLVHGAAEQMPVAEQGFPWHRPSSPEETIQPAPLLQPSIQNCSWGQVAVPRGMDMKGLGQQPKLG